MDNTICPVDYEANGQIIDDEINAIMVRPLAHGARLTAIFDCCHSGSAMDLPFTYNSDGSIKTSKGALKKLTSAGKSVGMHMLRGNVLGAAMSAAALFGGLGGATKSKAELERTKGNQFADVIMLSGCKDSQTSADSSFSGRASGALTFTFLEAMRQLNGRCSYGQLLTRLRTLLAQGYDQKPQLSSGRYMDMNQPFLI